MRLLNPAIRIALVLAGALLVVQPLLLWGATGRQMFTRYFNEARAAQEQASSQSDIASLFEDAGLNDGFEAIELPPNQFALGLLPSTYPYRVWDRDLLSVLTIAGPGALVALLALLPLRVGGSPASKSAKHSANTPTASTE